jgi:hypothetical protein
MGSPRPVAAALTITVAALLAGCGSTASDRSASPAPASPSAPAASPSLAASSASADAAASGSATGSEGVAPAFTPIPDASQAPDTGAGAAAGDVPDNAVFLTYRSAAWQFSIQYVEGWQVATRPDGVTIRDKDSSETVTIVSRPSDVHSWITTTDLPALGAEPGFRLVKRDRVRVGTATYEHLVFHVKSAPDPVTGKQVPSTADRFYVPGPGLAVVTLATPDGVDNVDAFRQMIGSFRWAAS